MPPLAAPGVRPSRECRSRGARPAGEARFSAPAPPTRWEGIRDALTYGATALQPHQEFTLIPEPTIEGDNCPNLNVFTPDLGNAGLPVLVVSTAVVFSPVAAPVRGTGETYPPG